MDFGYGVCPVIAGESLEEADLVFVMLALAAMHVLQGNTMHPL